MKISYFILTLFTFLILLNFTFSLESKAQPFTAFDMHKLKRLSGTVVSPDGKKLVYSVRQWNPETSKVSSHLEYTIIETKQSYPLTQATEGISDYNPAFSNGFGNTVLYLSTRSGKAEVWSITIPATGGTIPTATKFTNYPISITNFKWSWKNGNSLVFAADVYSTCKDDLKCTADRDTDIAKRTPNTWYIYDKLIMRHWDHWLSEKVSHIFVQKIKANSIKKGNLTAEPVLDKNPLDLMLEMETNSPVGPFGGSEMYDVHPDGTEVALSGADRTRDEAWNTGWKIYVATVGDASAPAVHLTTQIKARSDKLHIDIYDRTAKTFKNITGSYDRSVNDYTWLDNESMFFIGTDYGQNKIFRVNLLSSNLKGENVSKLLKVANFYGNSTPQHIPGTNTYFVERSSYQRAKDVWVLDYDSLDMIQITNVNPQLSSFELTSGESFIFAGGNHEDVQGFVFKPVNFHPGKRYPLAYLIHGGPEGAWETSWSSRWNVQLWTNHGYAVAVVNPHGSTGMGQAFTDKVRDDWGGLPYKDLMNGMDYIASHFSWINSKKACAIGASYGGFMVNWIQGQTDRFACLISHDGVFSTLTMFYATEELWFPMAEYCPINSVGCKPYDSNYRERYLKYSPEAYVNNWKTPQLVIHGTNDYRIPISEGISVFTALQMKGVPSRFVHMTQENHWVLKAENSIKWYDEVLGWMDKYTVNSAEKKVPEIQKEKKKLLK